MHATQAAPQDHCFVASAWSWPAIRGHRESGGQRGLMTCPAFSGTRLNSRVQVKVGQI